MNNCIICKKNNKGDNWRDCRLKCHYKYEQQKKDEIYKLKQVLQEIKQLVTTDYIKIKKQLVQNYDCLDNFMQKIENKCNGVQQ